MPLVRFSGEPVPFGPAERARSIADANAMVYRFGPPTWFFTFAPDYNDPFTIRLSVIANRSRSSEPPPGFPAEDGGFMAALRDWDERGHPESTVFELGFENTFSISNPILRNIICEGVTARANIYLSIKKAIFKALFGIQEDQDIKKTVALSSRITQIQDTVLHEIEDSSNEDDIDIADHIDHFEDDNDDFSVDAIVLDGATPAVTNLLIHGIIDQAGDMPMPPVRDNYERATDEFVMVYTVNGERVPIEP